METARSRKPKGPAPHVFASEQALLGGLIADPDAIPAAAEIVAAGDFGHGPHGMIFGLLVDAHAAGSPLDVITLPEELKRRGFAEPFYVHRLTEVGMVGTAALPEYAQRVVRAANIRRLEQAGRDVQQLASEAEDDEELAAQSEEILRTARERVKSRRPQGISARDLVSKDLPPIRFAVPQWFPQGLVLLHSRPKVGKTRLADVLALAVAAGGRFLGKVPVEQAGVLCLYLEDTEQTAQERLKAYLGDEEAPAGLDLWFEWRRFGEGGERDLTEYLARHPDTKLVIIDTLQMVRPPRQANGDIYEQDVVALRRFKDIADQFGACIVVLHHSKKGSAADDLVDSAGGTSGNTGSADTIMRLRKIPGDNEAVLEGRGRKVREFALALRLDERAGWVLLGDAAQVHQSSEEREVLELLKAEPLRPQDVAAELGISRNAAQLRLRGMGKRGVVTRSRGGWYALAAPPCPHWATESPESVESADSAESPLCPYPNKAQKALGTDGAEPCLLSPPSAPSVLSELSPLSTLSDPESEFPEDLDGVNGGRQQLWRLAGARGWPHLELGESFVIKRGRPVWERFCREVPEVWITRALRRLEARE